MDFLPLAEFAYNNTIHSHNNRSRSIIAQPSTATEH
jgi:hypothetical protein